MKIITQVRYGLRAILELSKPENEAGLLQKDISESQDISEKYLDHIITGLKKGNLIKNRKGKKSGYILAKKPEEISIYDIYQAFEKKLSIVFCLKSNELCDREKDCCAKNYWCDLNNTIIDHMKSTRVSQLL
jgi:Rrf2 family protein